MDRLATAKMPKSKRSKVVSLTKTDKKTKEWKENLFNKIRESIDTYDYVVLFMDDADCRCGYLMLRTCEIRI